MKRTTQKIAATALASLLVITGLFTLYPEPQDASAQCVPGETGGNLYGYAMTEHIGAIYMSTESWNDNVAGEGTTPSSVNFSVSHDRQTNTWDGRGWNKHVGWVDFGETNAGNVTNYTAEMESVKADPSAWGNWEAVIDLSGVSYTTDPGAFVGVGTNADYTIENGGSGSDDPVGTGDIDFSGVSFDPDPLPNCNEYVDLLLDGVNVLYRESCNIGAPTISYSTTDVSSCQTDAGLWQNQGPRTSGTGSETASGPITESNSPVLFRLRCIGNQSGNTVTGSAIASCGPTTGGPGGGIDPTEGLVIPDFREV